MSIYSLSYTLLTCLCTKSTGISCGRVKRLRVVSLQGERPTSELQDDDHVMDLGSTWAMKPAIYSRFHSQVKTDRLYIVDVSPDRILRVWATRVVVPSQVSRRQLVVRVGCTIGHSDAKGLWSDTLLNRSTPVYAPVVIYSPLSFTSAPGYYL